MTLKQHLALAAGLLLIPVSAIAAPPPQADVLPVPDLEPPPPIDIPIMRPPPLPRGEAHVPALAPRMERALRPFDPDNADLHGIARLDYPLDLAGFYRLGLNGQLPAPASFRLRYDPSGKITGCDKPGIDADPAVSTWFCDDVMQRGHVAIPEGFTLPFRTGSMPVKLDWNEKLLLFEPIRLLPRGQGRSVRMYFRPGKGVGECHPVEDLIDYSQGDKLCKVFLANPAVRARRFTDGTRMPRGSYDMEAMIWVAVKPLPAEETISAGYSTRTPPAQWSLWSLSYPAPPELTPENSTRDGTFSLLITSYDYPSEALRYELTGTVRLRLGFGSDGKPRSCRPIESTAVPLLDNETCKLALRRARYRLTDPAASYEGLRYKDVKVRWELPQD